MTARRYGLSIASGFDEVDRAAQGHTHQSFGKVEELVERRQAAIGVEFHQKVGVAGLWIEIGAARH